MSKVVEAELRLVGSDRTAGAFAGVIQHAEEMQAKLRGINFSGGNASLAEQSAHLRRNNGLLRAELALTQTVNKTFKVGNEAWAARTGLFGRMRQHAEGLAAISGMGWMFGGLASGRFAHSVTRDAAEFSHQRAMLAVGGMSKDEIALATRKSFDMRVPGMTAADNMRAIGELRTVFGSTAHALEHVVDVQRAASAMKAMNPEMNAEHEAYNLARALELKGVSNDPAHFLSLQNMMVKAINASHGKVTASDFLSFTGRAGAGTVSTLSDHFYSRIAPSLIQEMHPETAGRALATLRRQLLGGHMQLQSAAEWLRLGLVDPKKVEMDKIGHVKKIRPGAIVDGDLFSRDPYAWIQGYLKPALDRKGVVGDEKIAAEMATLFSDRYAENMATILLKQKQRIEKETEIFGGGAGLEAAEYARSHDALAASRDLSAAINSILSALGNPLTGSALVTMNKLADGARYIASSYNALEKANPWAARTMSLGGAAGLGYVGVKGFQATWGMLSGATALKGSAVALDASAAALNGAAARLAVTPAGAASSAGASAAAAGGAGAAGAGGLAGMISRFPFLFWGGASYSIATMPDVLTKTRSGRGYDQAFRDFSDPQGLEHILPGGLQPLSRNAMMNMESGLGWQQSGGTAEINTKITVEPSPDFITRIETMISNSLRNVAIAGVPPTGTSGSTGGAMPEALPGGISNHW